MVEVEFAMNVVEEGPKGFEPQGFAVGYRRIHSMEQGITNAGVELSPGDCDMEEDAGLEMVSPMFKEEEELTDALFSEERAKASATETRRTVEDSFVGVAIEPALGYERREGF